MGEEINPFEYQKPNEEQIKQIEEIRTRCSELSIYIESIQKDFKTLQSLEYMNQAIDKLQEVSMWANKAITFNK